MKNFLFLLAFAFCATSAFAQSGTAKGGCTTVTVTGIPTYNTKLWMDPIFWENCSLADPCCRRLIAGTLGVPRYYLQRKNDNGSWSTVMGPQSGQVFEITDTPNPHGVYRVRFNLPVAASCNEGGNISYYHYDSGKFAGYGGTYGFTLYTNTVIVGKTVASDNVFSFVDSDGQNSAPNGFDYQEIVKIDASGSKNYDQWWLAVLDVGNGAAQSTGWHFTPAGMVNLNNVWNQAPHEEWEFWPNHMYEVRFVVENSKCQNGDGWNEQSQFFFSCPAGSGCRFVQGVNPDVVISPNPASNTLRLSNFEPSAEQKYELTLTDMMGKTVKTVQGWNNDDMDISDLPQGTYILNLMGNGKPLFSDQFVVIR